LQLFIRPSLPPSARSNPSPALRAEDEDFVFIRPPGMAHGEIELRMDNVWFFKLLLLFEIEFKVETDCKMKRHKCAFVSVMEEFIADRKARHICYIHDISYILYTHYI
jgi:hypothetical protein